MFSKKHWRPSSLFLFYLALRSEQAQGSLFYPFFVTKVFFFNQCNFIGSDLGHFLTVSIKKVKLKVFFKYTFVSVQIGSLDDYDECGIDPMF